MTRYKKMGKKRHHAVSYPKQLAAKHISLSSHSLQLIISPHLLVQLHLHLIKEVGTAVVLPSLDVCIEAVAVL